MDPSVLAGLARWPNVPHVYGWLRLDRRGQWRLRDEVIRNHGIVAFIGRNYEADETGKWFFQNGPQRVFVSLDYTPWVVRLLDGVLQRQDGRVFAAPDGAYIDEEGSLLIASGGAAALVDDRDLPALLDCLAGANGRRLGEAHLDALLDGRHDSAELHLGARRLPLRPIRRGDVAHRFGFEPDPRPPG